MSNEKRPYKGGNGKPGHAGNGKPGNGKFIQGSGQGKFNQGSGQGEGGAKRKRRRRSGSGNGSGAGEQNRQQSQNSQRSQNQRAQNQRSQNQSSQGRQQKWDNNSRGDKKRFEPRGENRHENRAESRTGRRFDGLTSVERAERRAKTAHEDTKRGGGGASRRNKSGHERNRRSMSAREFSAAAPSARSRTADTARATVFDVLRSVAESDAYANLVLPKAIRSHRLDHRDAGFATELTYGTLRHQGTYDAILRHCVDRPLEKVGATTLIVLRMGVHQLLNMRVPAHAALNQSVSLAREKIGSGPASFINAVLRRVSERTPEEWYELIVEEAKDDTERQALLASHPAWIVRSMRQALVAHGRPAAEIEQLLEADNLAPVVNLVALPGLGSLEEAREQGAVDGELVEGSALYASGDLARLESVREGTVRAQDAGSQLVARALAAAPLDGTDTAWLDLCAGPGGKAALLGALGIQRGASLVANEAAPHRAQLVEGSMRPLPEGSYAVLTGDGREITSTLRAHASELPGSVEPDQLFDRVMVDVPCSGLGALRRRPEARWRKFPRDIAELLPLQRQLLDAAISVTRPGGVIAYVTCSPHAAETQNIVAEVLESGAVSLLDSAAILREVALHTEDANGEPVSVLAGEKDPGHTPEIKVKKGAPVVNASATTAQLWPHVHGTDAMFLALLRKN